MESIGHDGRTTRYRVVDGDGPTALYVHGSGASHRVCARQYAPNGPVHPAVAQWVTLERDWRPEALVLVGTGPELPVFADLLKWLADDFQRAIEFLHGRDRLFHATDDRLHERSREQLRAVGRAVTARDFLTCHEFDVAGRLAAVDTPTLALCGEHHRLTPRDDHERLASKLPRGEFAVVPDAAHLAMLERPSEFSDIVAGFLATHLGGYSG